MKKILLVDDDDFQLELMAGQLLSIGWNHVICAADGAQAMAHIDAHGAEIAAIISDLSMPDMDGLELLRHLAESGYAGGIILSSGLQDDFLSSAGRLAKAHGLEVLGCVGKPCTVDHLAQLLTGLRMSGPVLRTRKEAQILSPERLQTALDAGEFLAWYQPKADIPSGSIVGVEALARWPQADGSWVSPAVFVPALEGAGLVDALFFAIASQVASDVAIWRGQGINLKAALNLSMDTALNLDMPEQLASIVEKAGLRPADFVIEVTESRLMVDRPMAMESLMRLALQGFMLSIDDFGTGYSSLMQLIDLPFKELKIDGSFIQRSGHEPKAQTAVRLSSSLGMTLKMVVVAEGVETPEQLAFVRDSGCTIVQGYHLARPMPFADCTEWLSRYQGL